MLLGDKVSVSVGPNNVTWQLPIALLVSQSPYFRKALSGDWKEKKEGRIDLSDQNVNAFELVLQYLFTGRIDVLELSTKEKPHTWTSIRPHIRLYALAEYLQMPKLADLTMDKIITGLLAEKDFAGYLGSAETKFIIENVMGNAPLLCFAENLCAFVVFGVGLDPGENYDICFENESNFAVNVMNVMRVARAATSVKDPRKDKLTAYHKTEEGEVIIKE